MQIRARLSREPEFEIVGEADTSTGAIDLARRARPRIVLIDPLLRDGMGLQAVRRIVSELPRTTIIALTAFADTALRMELSKFGVLQILDKGIESKKLVNILREIGRDDSREKYIEEE